MPTNVYMGYDCPIGVVVGMGNTFLIRVQSFEVSAEIPTEERYELGNFVPVGLLQRETQYTGRITFNPVDVSLEEVVSGDTVPDNSVSWKEMLTSSGVTIHGPKGGLTGAVINAAEYSCRTGGDLTGTLTLDATGWDTGATVTATAPTGHAVLQAKMVTATVGGTAVARAEAFTLRAGCRVDRVYELGTANPIFIARHQPSVTVDLDFIESDNIAGAREDLTVAAPGNIVITVTAPDNDTLVYTAKNMVYVSKGQRANVGGYATRRYSYRSNGQDTTDYGLLITFTAG